MSDLRGTQFLDTAPDSRTPTRAPDAPDSLGEIAGAHWTIGKQDWAGAPEQAEIDAYGPVVSALAEREPKGLFGTGKNYIATPNSAKPLNYAQIWDDVAAQRRADPGFLKDVPARNAAEFSSWVQQQELARRRSAQGVVSRETGLLQKGVGFASDLGTGLVDPINLITLPLGGEIAGATKTLAGTMARDALINTSVTAAELPAIANNRAQFGEDMTAGDTIEALGMAGLGGAVFGAGSHYAPIVGKTAIRAVAATPAGKAAGRALSPLALQLARLTRASDGDVARAFSDAVPAGYRSPDHEAALHVLQRQADVDASNPFVPTAAGSQAHADKLTQALTDILKMPGDPVPTSRAGLAGGTALASGTVPTPQGAMPSFAAAGEANLSPSRVINFVMTDLEGGAKVVHYSDGDGGTTKYGIAAAHNPGVDVANLTAADAAAIARRKYWLPEFDTADPRAAAVAFDASYIGGPQLGRRILAESGGDPAKALDLYRAHLDHLADTNPAKAKYREGWNHRVDKLARFVGADGERPTLKPDLFAGDDETMRWAQRSLDESDMAGQLDEAERAPEIDVADNVPPDTALPPALELSAMPDGQAAGVALPDVPPAAVTAERPAPAPNPASTDAATPTAPAMAQRDPAEIHVAVRDYAGDRSNSLQPAMIAKALGITENQAAIALEKMVSRGEGDLIRTRGKWNKKGEMVRAPRIMRSPQRRGPEDLLYFLAKRGGIADNEGHDITVGMGLQRFVPGAGQLIREGGMSLDRARELAAEAGYFHDHAPDTAISDTTTADFLALLDQASSAPHYTAAETLDAQARAADAERADRISEVKGLIDARLTEHGFAFDRAQVNRTVDKMEADGLTADEAIAAIVNEDLQDALDAAAIEGESDRHAQLADDFAALAAGDGRPDQGVGERSGAAAGDASSSQSGADQFSGAAEDDAEAQGLNGPPPLDPKVAGGVDDPAGAQAKAIADSLEHDARAELDRGAAVDPNIADRQRQEARLKADAPMQAGSDQAHTIGAPLFDHADQFRIDVEGGERSTKDILDELDQDQAAIDAAKRCL